MKYRRFGRTEISMPVISCGGMRYQHEWDDIPWTKVPPAGQANLEECLNYALENGINHIETARGYGSSEMQLGSALKQFSRDSYILQTKVGPKENPREFSKAFETSMNYLQQDYVDLFALHGINNREVMAQAMRPGGCLEEARRFQKAGRVKHIGFSTHASNDEITELINSNEFEFVNLHWYFINQLNSTAIQAASRQDMGVFIISPNDKGGRLYDPPKKLVNLCHPLHPMAFNDLFCWANPKVHTLSCGVAKPEDFNIHLKALQYYESAAETIAPTIAKIRREVSEQFGPEWYDNWFKGIPDWEKLPHGINVKDIVRLMTCAKSLDLEEFASWRYNMLGNSGHWVPGNPVQTFDTPTMMKALRNNPFAESIADLLREAPDFLAGEKSKRLSES